MRDEFLAAILLHPFDCLLRERYADWLDENRYDAESAVYRTTAVVMREAMDDPQSQKVMDQYPQHQHRPIGYVWGARMRVSLYRNGSFESRPCLPTRNGMMYCYLDGYQIEELWPDGTVRNRGRY